MGISGPDVRLSVRAGAKRQVGARTRPVAPLGRCEDDRPPNAENERCGEQRLLPTGRARQKPIAGSSGVGSSAITRAASARGAHRLGGRVEPARLEDLLPDVEEQVASLFQRCLVAAQPDGYAQLKG